MKTGGNTGAQEAIFRCRIYLIFSAVAFRCLFLNASFCQEIGSYRTIATGNFGDISIWEVYDGALWSAASSKPTQANDIYIDQTHLVTLTGNEEAKSVFLNSDSGATQKLNLNNFNLNIYGSLQAFDGAAPGIPAGSHNSINWIGNSIGSTITFKGISRTIIPYNSWSAQSTRSRYSVIFDPIPGAILVVEEAFKALSFRIKTGTVIQQIDNSVNPGKCATFSFNNENTVAIGSYGDFIIESGGILLSKCDKDILFRSETVSANLLDLHNGAELILEGTSPQIEVANYQLNGKMTYNKNTGTQNFLSKSYTSSVLPSTFHDLEIIGSQNVTLPASLAVTGDISKVGTGTFILTNTSLIFIGPADQHITGFALSTQDLSLNKTAGEVIFEQNLTVLRNLTMSDGKLNFQDNTLTINSSGNGDFDYQGGSWENLSSFTYIDIPTTFNATNGTFPFGDRYHGGIRKVQMLGDNAGGDLTIDYTEYTGADFNPGFNDSDGTPILYRLFSYFNFSGLNSSSNPLELRISAENLIVDDEDDLRLVCTGYAAPGNHLPGMDPNELWARRNLTFNDLSGKNFTVGSFRTASILPVSWLDVSATIKNNIKQISWSVATETDNEKFEIYSAVDPLKDWDKIGEVLSKGNSEIPVQYTFIDENISNSHSIYYKIKVIDLSGELAWSKIVRLANDKTTIIEQVSIYPNPYSSGEIHIKLPDNFNTENTQIHIYTTQGHLTSSFAFDSSVFSNSLEMLRPGIYIINFSNSENSIQTRWIKN
ncbi:T9SS type A sorting domain-containing protein [Algoriphagus chordae]|uniref:Putative secreted protein (Por secretion system target) n=1 Tax=Algoriphagus chordae TaxID=237019 RepID=A0A2W7QMJ4_9BACT|nr:T9SS type A sorting domain-containing protein [Algoriphagus chordae]PZX48506.1 putative secreted protein (Por secretion system target) [Algoriphagus chordae]